MAAARRLTSVDVSSTVEVEAPEAAMAAGCPVDHEALAAAARAQGASKCPIDHTATAKQPAATGGCPVMHAPNGVRRSPADMVVRSVLRIKERPAGVSAQSAYAIFQRSMLISAIRCTLTYVVFPFLAPIIGAVTGVGPAIGVVIGTGAIVCDVFTIRRFFAVDHRWRWHFSAIAACIISLLLVLLVKDVAHLLG